MSDNELTRLDRVYEFTIEELYNAGGIEGMNDMCQEKYESENDGEAAGLLGNLGFSVHHVNVEQGLIGIRVQADIHNWRD